jgi:hypothetical protein
VIAVFAVHVLMTMIVIVAVVMTAVAMVMFIEITHFFLLGQLADDHVALDRRNMVNERNAV